MLRFFCENMVYNNGFILALISMGNEFLKGYINVAEGEKDPRNLLLAFSIARVLLIECDISNHVDVSNVIILVAIILSYTILRICSISYFATSQSASVLLQETHPGSLQKISKPFYGSGYFDSTPCFLPIS